jgi:hypothetical protein
MAHHSSTNRFHLFFIIALMLSLTLSLTPVRAAYAATSTSDLAIQLISAPRNAKAC